MASAPSWGGQHACVQLVGELGSLTYLGSARPPVDSRRSISPRLTVVRVDRLLGRKASARERASGWPWKEETRVAVEVEERASDHEQGWRMCCREHAKPLHGVCRLRSCDDGCSIELASERDGDSVDALTPLDGSQSGGYHLFTAFRSAISAESRQPCSTTSAGEHQVPTF